MIVKITYVSGIIKQLPNVAEINETESFYHIRRAGAGNRVIRLEKIYVERIEWEA